MSTIPHQRVCRFQDRGKDSPGLIGAVVGETVFDLYSDMLLVLKRLNDASIGKFKSGSRLGLRRAEQHPTGGRSRARRDRSPDAPGNQRRIGDVQFHGFGCPIGDLEAQPHAGRPAGMENEAPLVEERPRE